MKPGTGLLKTKIIFELQTVDIINNFTSLTDALWPSLNQNSIPHTFYSSNNCHTYSPGSAPFLDHPGDLSDKVSRLVSILKMETNKGNVSPGLGLLTTSLLALLSRFNTCVAFILNSDTWSVHVSLVLILTPKISESVSRDPRMES